MDEMWRDIRWITDALQYARYKQPLGGVPITRLVDASSEPVPQKYDSISSNADYLPTPSPSPELRRKATDDSQAVSDEEGCSEVFLPTDSDYDSSDALSPRDLDLVYSSAQDLSHQAVHTLSGSAPDVLQMHDLKPSACSKLMLETESFTKDLEELSLSSYSSRSSEKTSRYKRKLLSRSQPQRSCFSGTHRWLRVQSENQTSSLSEGVYTRQSELDLPLELPVSFPHSSYSMDEWKGNNRESKPTVRRIFVESCSETSPSRDGARWPDEKDEEHGGAAAGETTAQEVDSDDQTNELVSEILSSTL